MNFSNHPKFSALRDLILPFLSVLIVIMVLKPILVSEFWLLDDHLLIQIMDSEQDSFTGKLLLGAKILGWDGGFFAARATPVANLYYVLRAIIFDDNAKMFFILSLILGILCAYFLHKTVINLYKYFLIEIKIIHHLYVSLLILFLFTRKPILEIFIRLGTPEQLSISVGAITLFIFSKIMLGNSNILLLIILSINMFIITGTYEKYFWYPAFLYYALFKSSRISFSKRALRFSALFASLMPLFVMSRVFPFIIFNKEQAYRNSGDPSLIINGIKWLLTNNYSTLLLLLIIIQFYLLRRVIADKHVYLLLLFPFLILFVDAIYYGGNLVNYYLADVAIVAFWSASLIPLITHEVSYKTYDVTLFVTATFVAVILFPNWIMQSSNYVKSHVNATKSFQNGVNQIVSLWKTEQHSSILFLAQTNWDYESAISLGKFLNHRIDGEFSYFVYPLQTKEKTDLMISMSSQGNRYGNIKPFSKFQTDKKSICVFSINKPITIPRVCAQVVSLQWL